MKHPGMFNASKAEGLVAAARDLEREANAEPIGSGKATGLFKAAKELRDRATKLDPDHWLAVWEEPAR